MMKNHGENKNPPPTNRAPFEDRMKNNILKAAAYAWLIFAAFISILAIGWITINWVIPALYHIAHGIWWAWATEWDSLPTKPGYYTSDQMKMIFIRGFSVLFLFGIALQATCSATEFLMNETGLKEEKAPSTF